MKGLRFHTFDEILEMCKEANPDAPYVVGGYNHFGNYWSIWKSKRTNAKLIGMIKEIKNYVDDGTGEGRYIVTLYY